MAHNGVLVTQISKRLMNFGTESAYPGTQFRLQIGDAMLRAIWKKNVKLHVDVRCNDGLWNCRRRLRQWRLAAVNEVRCSGLSSNCDCHTWLTIVVCRSLFLSGKRSWPPGSKVWTHSHDVGFSHIRWESYQVQGSPTAVFSRLSCFEKYAACFSFRPLDKNCWLHPEICLVYHNVCCLSAFLNGLFNSFR